MYDSVMAALDELKGKIWIIIKRFSGSQNITKTLNNIGPRSIDFWDCNIWNNDNNKLETDLFVKSSDRITYLEPSSCYPKHVCRIFLIPLVIDSSVFALP